ncbi:MAG: hypothetical protein RJA33_604 [Actinomycetota bacterium]|jgi:hypothetical protein
MARPNLRSFPYFYASIALMTGRNRDESRHDDDEMDLINAEFESMVSGLSLDESAPTTYLDELDAIAAADSDAEVYTLPPRQKMNLHQRVQSLRTSFNNWWRRGHHEDDGAVL